MRTLVNSTYITLDGVIENPQDWPSLGGFTDQGHQLQRELLEQCDAVLMGRHTYDGFAPVWSAMSGDPVSDRMNALPKYVVSNTLAEAAWGPATVLRGDPRETVAALRSQPGRELQIHGSARLGRSMLAAGLVDELRLVIAPVVVGAGRRLFTDGGAPAGLRLISNDSTPGGLTIQVYETTGAAAFGTYGVGA